MDRSEDLARVRRFLGMVDFLAQFVPKLSDMAEPLTQLTCKDNAWEWAAEQEDVFTRIKESLITAPVLQYFHSNKQVVIQCDASQHGLGAVIMQDGKPVVCASRSLTATERQYAQIEKDLLASGVCDAQI